MRRSPPLHSNLPSPTGILSVVNPSSSTIVSNLEYSPDEESPGVRIETDLVAQARGGDANAFERLYRENVGRIHGLCRRLTGDSTLAEDLTQEVFVRTWEKLPTFRGRSAFSSWLHRLAVNVVLGDRRASARRNARVLTVAEPEAVESIPLSVAPGGDIDLERAIAALPPGARTVFILHDVEGYRHEEIAGFIGVTVGTSKGQLHRARKLLKEALNDEL